MDKMTLFIEGVLARRAQWSQNRREAIAEIRDRSRERLEKLQSRRGGVPPQIYARSRRLSVGLDPLAYSELTEVAERRMVPLAHLSAQIVTAVSTLWRSRPHDHDLWLCAVNGPTDAEVVITPTDRNPQRVVGHADIEVLVSVLADTMADLFDAGLDAGELERVVSEVREEVCRGQRQEH